MPYTGLSMKTTLAGLRTVHSGQIRLHQTTASIPSICACVQFILYDCSNRSFHWWRSSFHQSSIIIYPPFAIDRALCTCNLFRFHWVFLLFLVLFECPPTPALPVLSQLLESQMVCSVCFIYWQVCVCTNLTVGWSKPDHSQAPLLIAFKGFQFLFEAAV